MAYDGSDFLGDVLREARRRQGTGDQPKPAPAEKGVQIRVREIDGTYYVRAEDVVALLEANAVLPKISARLKAKTKGGA